MARLFRSKKTMNLVLLGLAVVAVLYFVLNTREGFAGGNVVTKTGVYSANNKTFTLSKEEFGQGPLTNIRFYVYGPASADKKTINDWVQRTEAELNRPSGWMGNATLRTELITTSGATQINPSFARAGQRGFYLLGDSIKLGAGRPRITDAVMASATAIKVSNMNSLNWGSMPEQKLKDGANFKIEFEFGGN